MICDFFQLTSRWPENRSLAPGIRTKSKRCQRLAHSSSAAPCHSAENDLVVDHSPGHARARQELTREDQLRQRVFDPALNGTLERTCTVPGRSPLRSAYPSLPGS